jgi:hypothetical protein
MLPRHVAVVSQTGEIQAEELARVASAIQKQVTRDFGPLWGINATVDVFPSLDAVPVGYWHVVVRDDIDRPGEAGYHETELDQPVAAVQFDDDWSVTASHEILEMLADPFGRFMTAAEDVRGGQGSVLYIVEVCDPCEASTYSIDEVRLSDFCTAQYFGPDVGAGQRYSFTGSISKPREVLKGGYLSFIDPTDNHLRQLNWQTGAKPRVIDLGDARDGSQASLRLGGESLRQAIDRMTPRVRKASRRRAKSRATKAGDEFGRRAREAHARSIQRLIDEIVGGTVVA